MKNQSSSTNKQNKQPQKQQNLQFKSFKKRTLKRPFRSKSTFQSIYDKYQQSDQLNNLQIFQMKDQNIYKDQQICAKQLDLQDLTHTHINYNIRKNNQQLLQDQYAKRKVKRFRPNKKQLFEQQPIYDKQNLQNKQLQNSLLLNQNKIQQYFYFNNFQEFENSKNYSQSKNCSQQSIETRQHFSLTTHEWKTQNQVESNHNTNHFRNKSQSTSLTKCYSNQSLFQRNFERSHNFQKNKILSRLISINTEVNSEQLSKKFKISDFQLGLCLHEDSFGKIYPARHIFTGFILCIKQINKKQVNHQVEKLIECLKLQSFMNNQYIVQIYGIFQQKDRIYVLMQYHSEGNLYLKLKLNRKISQKDSLSYFHNICCAVKSLHNLNIVYRNLKTQNLSLYHGICKISNLNWSCHIENQKCKYLGAMEQCSPQLFQGKKYTKQCDIWALGILFFELIVGVTPCYNFSSKKTKQIILNGQFGMKKVQNINIRQFLLKILQKELYLRPTIANLISQIEFIQKSQNFV